MDDVPTDETPLVRTAGSPETWEAVRQAFSTPSPEDGFLPEVTYVDEPAYLGLSPAQVVAALPGDERAVVFIADEVTESSGELLVLAVNPGTHPPETFRLLPSEAWSVESNLFIANMDWEEFADAVDDAGVFRGF